jgi:signal transduction histidine kinase/FixJ family two-component response regulator
MDPSLRVLHLEDDHTDADIVRGLLESGGVTCQVTRVETRDDFIAALEKTAFDLILADFSLPSFDGLSALRIALERCPDVPFIFVSGALGEELAIDALKIGATDYVLKERLSRIVTSVRRALREASDRAERKQAEQQLRRSEAFLAEGQRISHTGSWGWVLSSGKVIWSEEQYRMLGFEPGSAEPSVDLFVTALHADDRARVRHILEEATNAKQSYAMSYRVVLPDGSVRHLHTVGRPVATEVGEVDEYIGSSSDITERVEADAALRQAQRLEAMGVLAGGIAHDFNNILGAILGYGELAQKGAPEGSNVRRYLDNVMLAGGRAKSLVERILAFSRSSVSERGPINVQAVIEEALELLATSLAPSVRLDKRLEAGDAAIVGDATQLHQVAMNLCTNALQAMKNGGVLEVVLDRTGVAQSRTMSHGNLVPGPYVRLCVSDTGSGIPQDVLDRMFDPFFTTKGAGEGTGLGLSLVHRIVADLGGVIDVRTTVGRGTTFTIWLPNAGEVTAPSPKGTTELPHGDGQTVMIVDDEKPLVALAEEILAKLGYEPVGFNTSGAALDAFREAPQRFDIVLTDETMPQIVGTDLAREIRLLRPDIPIVLMSGYSGASLDERARAVGIREVLRKPLQSKDIAECFGRVLR